MQKKNEYFEKLFSIQQKYASQDKKAFWKDIKRNKEKLKKSQIIDNTSSNLDILNIFTEKFVGTFRESNIENKFYFSEYWNTNRKMHLKISGYTLKNIIKNDLNDGLGSDGIHYKLFKYATHEFLDALSRFYNICFIHCYFPKKMLIGEINPRIKNVKMSSSSSSNYRPVMQSSYFMKLPESFLLHVLEEKICFNQRQFAYKKGSSTTDATYVLKETIKYGIESKFCNNNNRVYALFVDLKKAFENVKYDILSQIMIEKKNTT